MQEGVQYKTRKINLESVPYIGGILKALDVHELETKLDIVLKPKKDHQYFLFLNDLFRKPEEYDPRT
jgi:hypothetical protein